MSIDDLIQGCKKQNPNAQKALVLNYSSELLTVSRRYSPSKVDAEDILQDAFIKIFEKINQYNAEKGSLKNWMRKIVINTALKRLEKSFFKNERYLAELPERIILPEVYQKLNAEAVMDLIQKLPDGYRQVFNLYAIEGYSHKEIGKLLGIAAVTSRSNYMRAKILLKKKLGYLKIEKRWMKII